jgi:hypothetical protein
MFLFFNLEIPQIDDGDMYAMENRKEYGGRNVIDWPISQGEIELIAQ